MIKAAEIDWPTVAKMFGGGALLGGGIGAATSLARYLQSLQTQAAHDHDTSQDDDILYLNLPSSHLAKHASAVDNPMTFAGGGLATLLGTYLAYNAVRGIYQKQRRAEAQKHLDGAQQIYLGGLSGESGNAGNPGNPGMGLQKNASQFSPLSKLGGSGYLLAILGALGSAAITNQILKKQYPPIKPPNRGMLRKIVIRTPEEESVTPGPVNPDAAEHLLRTQLNGKSASISGFADLVTAVAAGWKDEVYRNSSNLDLLFDTIKGASVQVVDPLDRELAIMWLSRQPKVAVAIQPYLAACFYDDAPGYCKMASVLMRDRRRVYADLCGLAACFPPLTRQKFYSGTTKSANLGAIGANLAADLVALQFLDNSRQPEQMPENAGGTPADVEHQTSKHAPTSQDSPTKPSLEVQDDGALAFMNRYGTSLDQALLKM